MSRRVHAFLLAVATFAHVAGAADAPASQPQAAEPPTAGTRPALRDRAVSPATAERLATAAPRFLAPETASIASAETREPDQPRNTIIRLPRFVVDEPKVQVPDDFAVLTMKGRLDLALKRHPGLRFGPASWLNGPIGLAMIEEDERVNRLTRMAELASFLGFAESPATDDTRRLIQQTFARANGWIGYGGSFQLSR